MLPKMILLLLQSKYSSLYSMLTIWRKDFTITKDQETRSIRKFMSYVSDGCWYYSRFKKQTFVRNFKIGCILSCCSINNFIIRICENRYSTMITENYNWPLGPLYHRTNKIIFALWWNSKESFQIAYYQPPKKHILMQKISVEMYMARYPIISK